MANSVNNRGQSNFPSDDCVCPASLANDQHHGSLFGPQVLVHCTAEIHL